MQFIATLDAFLSQLEAIETTMDAHEKYGKTMEMLMDREVRQLIGAYLTSYSLAEPRSVLAMVMVALNYSHILDLSSPQDMIVRAEAERFYPVFKRHYRTNTDPTICVNRGLEAFKVWKAGDQAQIVAFTQDQIARHRLKHPASEGPPPYWARILMNSKANLEEMRSLYGPVQVRRTSLPTANVGQLFAAVEDHVLHPYLKQFVRLRAPNGPVGVEAGYLQVLAQFLSLVHGKEIAASQIRETISGTANP